MKRKKAESSGKAVKNSSEEAVNERQQPNLIELSKDLPSGWQVCGKLIFVSVAFNLVY